MFSNSLNNIANSFNIRKIPKNIPKKIKIKKLILGHLSPNYSLTEKLPEMPESLTPRPKKNLKKIKIISPIKKTKFNSVENYLISTSLLSKYDDKTVFDFSYFKKLSNKYSPLVSKKEIHPLELTNNTKKACRENILLNILKKKREEISKDEKLIQYSLKEYRRQIENDFMKFKKINNEYQSMKRRENKILGYYRSIYQKTKRAYITEIMNQKRLKDTIEKMIRDIYKLKEYAYFIHSMYGIPFIMDQISDDLLYDNKFDILSEQLINLYTPEELEKEDEKKERLLKNINLFMKSFILYENNIIHLLKEENLIIKDIYFIKIDNKKRLQHLIRRKENYVEDKRTYKKIHYNFNNELISSAGQSQNEQYDEFIDYILQFTKIFDIPTSLNKKHDKEVEYYKYCQDIQSVLRDKESFIDNCVKEICEILNSENDKDKTLMENIILERKKYNLEKLQMKIKENKLQKIEMAKMKIMDKNSKKVVKGRMISDYKFIILNNSDLKKRMEMKEKNKLNNNDINIEYCFSEYDKKADL